MSGGRTIRFEDLGEPVQKLLRSLKGGVSAEDMALLEFVSVKDMAKIYSEMSSDKHAELIWQELKQALEQRREKAERKKREMEDAQLSLADKQAAAKAEAEAAEAEEAARRQQEEEDAERRRRKEERRRRKAEEQAAEEASAEEAARAAEEEAQRLAAEEEERQRREERRKRREEKARKLQEEELALEEERERQRQKSKASRNQKRDWDDYVKQHPLDFARNEEQQIEQVKVERATKPPPSANADLLNRTYTPKCPNCNTRRSAPPPQWDCEICLRRHKQKFKCWQPDEETSNCAVCKAGVGRFSRHHCRNCGRVVCSKCSEHKAAIPSLGFPDPVKICNDCATLPKAPSPAPGETIS